MLIDISSPRDGSGRGRSSSSGFGSPFGELIGDVASLLTDAGVEVEDAEIGSWGCVHLYLAVKPG